MIIDYENKFSDALAVTDTDKASTNLIDLGAAGDAHTELFLVIRVGTAFAGGTSINFSLQTATDEAFTSPVTLIASGAILTAALTANTIVWKVRVPRGALRYLRIWHDVTGTMSAGTLEEFLTPDIDANDLGS